MKKVQVGVNGDGVIGQLVADATLLQPDMELVGIADVATDWRIKSAVNRLPLFASTEDAKLAMIAAGLRPRGTLDELLEHSEIRGIAPVSLNAVLYEGRWLTEGLRHVIHWVLMGGALPSSYRAGWSVPAHCQQAPLLRRAREDPDASSRVDSG